MARKTAPAKTPARRTETPEKSEKDRKSVV